MALLSREEMDMMVTTRWMRASGGLMPGRWVTVLTPIRTEQGEVTGWQWAVVWESDGERTEQGGARGSAPTREQALDTATQKQAELRAAQPDGPSSQE
jgi:hypothetical protein